jgi:hypothetical protein
LSNFLTIVTAFGLYRISILRVFLILALFNITACNSEDKNRGKAIAKVGDEYLYEKDLKEAMPKGTNQEDSLQFSESFIISWIKENLMYKRAEQALSKKEKNKDKELNEYYSSLIRQELIKKEVSFNLDRHVTEKEIQTYYKENSKNFELKRNIIRFLYVKIPKNTPNNISARVWIRNHDKMGMEKLLSYSRKYAPNYNLDTTVWYYFDDITKEIPVIENYNPEHFVQNNNYVELRDAEFLYLLNVIDNRIRDDVSPINVVRGRIKNIILNIRRVKEIQRLENKVYDNK